MASQCSVELSALVEKACEAYHIRQDGLLDLYYLEDIIYAIGIREKDVTEEVYGYVGQAEEETREGWRGEDIELGDISNINLDTSLRFSFPT